MQSMWISGKRGLKESSGLTFHSRKSMQKQKSSSSNITVSLASTENHWKSWKWFPQKEEKQRGNHSVGRKIVTFHNKLLGTILTLQSMWKINTERISSVQSLSRVRLFVTPWTATHQAFLSITNSWSLLKLMSIESMMPSNHLILCHPLLLLPSIIPSFRVFTTSYFFISSGHNIGASASASVLPMNIQEWMPLGWTGWISLKSKGLSRVFSNITVQNINSSALSFLYSPTLTSIHNYWESHSFD